MHNKFFIFLTLSVFLFSGCSSPQKDEIPLRQILSITTQAIHNNDNIGYISKSARVQGSSEITLTSQIGGRIQTLPYRIGNQVGKTDLLVSLTDIGGSVSFGVQKSQLAKEIAQYNYDIQSQAIRKQSQDSNIALQKAKIAEEALRQDVDKQKQKIDYDLVNIDESVTGSLVQIQLEKLQKDLAKAEFDYQAKLKSDNQTSQNFITSAKNIQSDLQIILADTVNEADKILGVTELYINDTNYKDMRIYIGAKDITINNAAKDNFWKIVQLQNELKNLKSNDIDEINVDDYLTKYQAIVSGLSEHFVLMKQVFVNSIEDSRYVSQMSISEGIFASLQSRSSALNASITAQLNGMRSYFASYSDTQESLARQIESLRSQIALSQKSLNDSSFNTILASDRSLIALESQLQNTKLSTESVKFNDDFVSTTQNKNLSLAAKNLIISQITEQEAFFNQSKFRIFSPIAGSISDIFVDIGQDIAPGTPLLKIVSVQQQIEISLTQEEVTNIVVGQSVIIESDIGEANGVVTSVSQVADKTSSFKVLIALSIDSTIPTGLSVDVKLPVQQGTVVLPINALMIVDTNTAVAHFWDTVEKKIVSKTLTIQSIFGDQVEVLDRIEMHYELVLTDLSFYDQTTMEIQKATK